MTNENKDKIINGFIAEMMAVPKLQTLMLLVAANIRKAVITGESASHVLPMAEYLEKQSAHLDTFIRGLENPPVLTEPAKPTKAVFDPKAN